jgi:hypothetical protein
MINQEQNKVKLLFMETTFFHEKLVEPIGRVPAVIPRLSSLLFSES